jgi:hypothetical protein
MQHYLTLFGVHVVLLRTIGIISSYKIDQHTRKLTPWSWVLLEKPKVDQPLKKYTEFYRTRNFIAMLKEPTTDPDHQHDESSPHFHPISLR